MQCSFSCPPRKKVASLAPGFELFPVTHDQILAMSSRYASAVQIPWREGDRREPGWSMKSRLVSEDLTLKVAFALCHPNPGISQLAQRDYAWSLVTLLKLPIADSRSLDSVSASGASGAPNSISCFMMVCGRSPVFHFHPFSVVGGAYSHHQLEGGAGSF